MNHNPQPKLALTDPAILLSEHYYRRLWLATGNVDISRREWLDELADTFRDFEGLITTHHGLPFELPFIDDVFDDDEEMRWMSYYLLANVSGCLPRSRSRKIKRLQLIDLYFQIKHPHIARHFAR
ncbi:MAG: hypothetical protein COB14_09265 [Alphaproteobacteria bacterium]|nr:MAG: hypothetical protein COB14_09265 [Alphaproteobacteria bacterium]